MADEDLKDKDSKESQGDSVKNKPKRTLEPGKTFKQRGVQKNG